jgi:hypothetical protein
MKRNFLKFALVGLFAVSGLAAVVALTDATSAQGIMCTTGDKCDVRLGCAGSTCTCVFDQQNGHICSPSK